MRTEIAIMALERMMESGEAAYETPAQLMEACLGYVHHMKDHPLFEAKRVSAMGGGTEEVELPKERIMTVESLRIWLGIGQDVWADFSNRPGFAEIKTMMVNLMTAQRVEGASAGILNANFIARLEHLADHVKQEVESNTTVSDKTLDPTKLSTATLLELQSLGYLDTDESTDEPTAD